LTDKAVIPVATTKHEAPYSPPVSKVSQKLAQRREEKDRTPLSEILANTAPTVSFDDPSFQLDDDALPPPPPTSLSKESSDGDLNVMAPPRSRSA